MKYQTTVKNLGAIKFGSAKFEISSNGVDWTDLGAMRELVFEEMSERSEISADNTGPILVGIRDHRVQLSGNLMEIDLANLNVIRGGIDNYSTVDGILVSGVIQDFVSGQWGYNDPVAIENQNCNKSQLTINSVTGSVDGALVAGTDYFVGVNEAGDTVVTVIDSATVTTEDQTITVNYDYTPCAKKVLKSGGKMELSSFYARFTNLDEEDKMFRITVHKAENAAGIVINYQPDEGEDPDMIPITIIGRRDNARTAGEQLFTIEDEQGVS